MQAERAKILEMLRDGRVSVEQAERLLDALGKSEEREHETADAGPIRPPHFPHGAPAFAGGLANIGRTIAGQVASAFGGRGGRSNFGTTRLTAEGLTRIESDSSYTNFGVLTIADDVPEDLLAEKIAGMTNFGTVTGPENLVRLLESRCDTNFGAFQTADEDDEDGGTAEGRHKMGNLGKTILTQEQLEHMADGVEYENLGKLVVSEDVSEDLLSRKIAVYRNLGKTEGPKHLLGVLQARCPENLGKFLPTGVPDDDGDEE